MPTTTSVRLCHVVKKDEEFFEFFLLESKQRKGQIVTALVPDGPADRAGLQDGDRIIEINGKNVENKTHAQVAEMIRESIPQNEITFRVVAEKEDQHENKMNGELDLTKLASRPRVCKIKKKRKKTFGFHLETKGLRPRGHFIKVIVPGTPAAKSGLREGDRVIEVGKTNIEKMSHANVVELIKKCGKKLKFLVVDEATYRQFADRKIVIKPDHAYRSMSIQSYQSSNFDKKDDFAEVDDSNPRKEDFTSSAASIPALDPIAPKPVVAPQPTIAEVHASADSASDSDGVRLIHVIRSKTTNFGFSIKKKKHGVLVKNLEEDKPGKRCGLLEDDQILTINGKVVLACSHEEILQLIDSVEHHLILLVFNDKARRNARNAELGLMIGGAKKIYFGKPKILDLGRNDRGYGFRLKTEKVTQKHVIGEIDDESPAHLSNLHQGEVLLCIDDTCVMHIKHKECVQMIKNATEQLQLTVALRATADILYDLKVEFNEHFLASWPDPDMLVAPDLTDYVNFFRDLDDDSSDSDSDEESLPNGEKPNPRLCTLTKVDGAFGFFLRDGAGHYLNQIEKGGSADLAGVIENDKILEINGVNVESESHGQVVDRINDSGDKITFLVVATKQENDCRSSISSTTSLIDLVPNKPIIQSLPRFCHLTDIGFGFGFKLTEVHRTRKDGHFIEEVKEGGVAHKAGIRNGDRLIEINDINIEEKTHEEVASMIKESGTTFTMLVIDQASDLFHKEHEIKITKSLIMAAAVVETHKALHSSSSSSSSSSEENVELPPPSADLMVFEHSSSSSNEEESDKHEEVMKEFDSLVEEMKEDLHQEALEDANLAPAETLKASEEIENFKESIGSIKSLTIQEKLKEHHEEDDIVLREFHQELIDISDSSDDENDGSKDGEILKIVALSAMAAKITEEDKKEESDHNDSSSEDSSRESDAEESLKTPKMSVNDNEFSSISETTSIPIPPPPPLSFAPPSPPLAGVSAAALVIHKKDEIKPESLKTSPHQTRHSLTADMLAEIASSLKPVQREEIEKNEKQEPVGLPLSNGVTATSSSSSSSSSSSASSSPDEKRKFPLRPDPISQVHFNGVVNLETPNRIQWSGDGLTMNIIETSTFNN